MFCWAASEKCPICALRPCHWNWSPCNTLALSHRLHKTQEPRWVRTRVRSVLPIAFLSIHISLGRKQIRNFRYTKTSNRLPNHMVAHSIDWHSGKTRGTRAEVPETINAEQRLFIVLTFFSADSENMKNISSDQLCFRADQLWFSLNQRCSELKSSALFQSWTALFQREAALNQRCSALIFTALKHWIFSPEQRWFSTDLLWISSDINTRR